ncbi:MAG: hypothetical protein IT438_06000 [Phycisphaerales bacterium]|nr:hypothetical protein [Phycisphaerales bacterium]
MTIKTLTARPCSASVLLAAVAASIPGISLGAGPQPISEKPVVAARQAIEVSTAAANTTVLHARYTPARHSAGGPVIVDRGPGCPTNSVTRFRAPRPGFSQDFDFDNIQAGQELVIQAGFAQQEIAAASFQIPDSEFPIKINMVQAILGTVASVPTTTRYTIMVWDGTPPSSGAGALYSASSDSTDPASPPDLSLPAAPGQSGSSLAAAIGDIRFSVDDMGVLEDAWVVQPIGNPSAMHTVTIGIRIDQHNNQTANPCTTAPPQASNAFPCTEPATCCTPPSLLTFPNDNWLYGLNCGAAGCPANGGMVRFSQLSANGCLIGFCTGCRPSGDWALRLQWSKLGCLPATGSCCDAGTGACIVNQQVDCLGAWTENGVCDPNPCPQPPGACCFTGGTCQSRDANSCAGFGGTFLGVGTTCVTNACVARACCIPSNGACLAGLFPAQCAAAGGVSQGVGSTCDVNNCPQPTGACCFTATGFCALDTQANCTIPGTVWAGAGVACSQASCPSTGACCAASGFCSAETASSCAGVPGATFQGVGTSCTPDPCVSSGACCCGSTCMVVAPASCVGANHAYIGNNTACNPAGNSTSPCCKADYNQVGGISVQDIFDYLAGYFSTEDCANINQTGGISVQDIFDFLSAYFAGGC